MNPGVDKLSWPISRLGEALQTLAQSCGLPPRQFESAVPPEDIVHHGQDSLGRWIETAARRLGLEADAVEVSHPEVAGLLRRTDLGLLRLPGEGDPGFMVLLGSDGRLLSVLGPDLKVKRIRVETVRAALCRGLERPLESEMGQFIDTIGVSKKRRERACAAIMHEQLRFALVSGFWRLRLPPGADFWRQARRARLPHRLTILFVSHALQYVLWLLSWWMVGRGALDGRLDTGWLMAWALLLLTLIPFRLLETWLYGLLATGAGGLLKQRLLYGALRLEPEEIRHQGAGQLLGCVLEAEAVESLALSGGFLGLVAAIELLLAGWVLGSGAGGWLHGLLLAAWVALAVFVGWRYFVGRHRWTQARLDMTYDLTERMVGHRTRLAQEARERWHDGEDQALEHYLGLSYSMDRTAVLIISLVPRGWLVVGLCGIAPSFVFDTASPAMLAVSLGGLLLAYRALDKLAASLWHLAGAGIAWKQVASLFHAAARPETTGSPDAVTTHRPAPSVQPDRQTVLEGTDLVFRYRSRGEPVLRGCSLKVRSGDRLLLEGPSGGGKSTLAALLTGLRVPESGLLLLRGLDHQTLGADGWRRLAVAAPQFHENHVLTGTLAFNLLLGRRWPARPEDFQEAGRICDDLGLGPLLGRMPAGLLQMVGESGWQLSHGEKSRLYIARALLQGCDLVVLDESFAALDPETLQMALGCVLKRAATLLVIAHP